VAACIRSVHKHLLNSGSGLGSCPLKNFDVIIQQIYFRHTADHVQHMVHCLVEVGFIVAYRSYCQGSLLPEIIIVYFSHGNIELVPDSILQAANRVPLGFQGTAFRNMYFYRTNSDKHILVLVQKITSSGTFPVLQFSRNFIDHIGLNDITHFKIVEVLDADAAFVSCLHFAGVILEPLE